MGEEGDIMAYSRVEKYQELRDGLKDEAGINRKKSVEEIEVEVDEDDDFLSFMKNDEHIDKEISLEDTLTEAKTFEQMRNENSKELEEALKSAKRGVGKESQYNTRMDILSKIRDSEKTTIKIDSVDEYQTDEFARGIFLNNSDNHINEEKPIIKEKKKMTFMQRLASMSPEEDVKKAEEFLKNEEKKEETFDNENIQEENIQEENNENVNVEQKISLEPENDIVEIEDHHEKQEGKLVNILDVIITVLVIVFIVLLGVIIYQNFF